MSDFGRYCPVELENFHQQIISNLPYNATEIVRFLKTFKIRGFFDKIDGFFQKKTQYFIADGGKFTVECVFFL